MNQCVSPGMSERCSCTRSILPRCQNKSWIIGAKRFYYGTLASFKRALLGSLNKAAYFFLRGGALNPHNWRFHTGSYIQRCWLCSIKGDRYATCKSYVLFSLRCYGTESLNQPAVPKKFLNRPQEQRRYEIIKLLKSASIRDLSIKISTVMEDLEFGMNVDALK